jgi:hypothetical protein
MKNPPGKKTVFVQVDVALHEEFSRVCRERNIRLREGIELAMVNEIEVAKGNNPRAVQGSAEQDRVIKNWLSLRGEEKA